MISTSTRGLLAHRPVALQTIPLLVLLAASCTSSAESRRQSRPAREITGSTELLEAVAAGESATVEAALVRGVEFRLPNADGQAALHLAAEHGFTDIATMLVEAGAAVGERDRQGATPLHYAAGMGDAETAALLVEHGADVMARTYEGVTPLHRAAELRNREMAQITKSLGMPAAYDWKTENVQVARLLITNGADVDARDNLGRTPLQRTTPWNNYPVAKLLVENGADKSLSDNQGMTPYDHAVAKGARDVAGLLK